MQFLWVGIGGFIGAMARYGVMLCFQKVFHGFYPIATLTVNGIGSLFIGFLMAWFPLKGLSDHPMKLMLVTGVLGALTTFSAFAYETWDLFVQKRYMLGAAHILLNVCVCLLLVVAGVWLGHRMGLGRA